MIEKKETFITARTISGSIYQIDTMNKKVRRIFGEFKPTNRQNQEGNWQEYKAIHVMPNQSLFFDWTGMGNGTITSQVINIENVNLETN